MLIKGLTGNFNEDCFIHTYIHLLKLFFDFSKLWKNKTVYVALTYPPTTKQ